MYGWTINNFKLLVQKAKFYLFVKKIWIVHYTHTSTCSTLFSSEFTWYTLHKPVLSRLCMEGMQSHDRLLPHGRIELHLYFQHLQALSQDFDQHTHVYSDDDYSVQPSGSHCTPVSRRKGRWSFLISSALFPWWKHSTLHMVHCGYDTQRVVQLWCSTLNHIDNHAKFVSQMCTASNLGH